MQKFGTLSETKVKILMLGESGSTFIFKNLQFKQKLYNKGVGKSSILLRFADDKFQSGYVVTLGVEFKQKKATVNDKDVLIQVWDTAGQEQFRTITPIYYRNVDGVVIVYDITDEHSFDSVNYWMNNLKDYADSKIVGMLVGNKCDMNDKRIISTEMGQSLASKFQNIIEFTETSAKGSINIKEVFIKLTEEILQRRQQGNAVQQALGQELPMNQRQKKSGCCGGGSKKK